MGVCQDTGACVILRWVLHIIEGLVGDSRKFFRARRLEIEISCEKVENDHEGNDDYYYNCG